MPTVWVERKDGCHGLTMESVKELEAQCKAQWVQKDEPKGYRAYKERKHYFEYPDCFPIIFGGTLEVRLVIAKRLKELDEANLATKPGDFLRIEITDLDKRRGFILTAWFSDSISDEQLVDCNTRHLEIPLSCEAGIAFIQPTPTAKKWKAKQAEDGNPFVKPAEGCEEWRIAHEADLGQHGNTEIMIRQSNIKVLQGVVANRRARGLPANIPDEAWLNEMLEEEAAYQTMKETRAARQQEMYEDFEAALTRMKAVKELGLRMPPKPEGWDDMIRECDEVAQLTERMAARLRKVGRPDNLTPYRFLWDGIWRHFYFGGAFAVVFNDKTGPIEAIVLPSYTTPIRAMIAPEKAMAEWRAIKAYREEQKRSLTSEEPLEEMTYDLMGEVLGGWKRKPLNFTGIPL